MFGFLVGVRWVVLVLRCNRCVSSSYQVGWRIRYGANVKWWNVLELRLEY